jgi:two-component system phosphate regulon sensor histidine kinase PhoR
MSSASATTPIFACPQCHAPVRAGDTTCRACGINLALAAVLAERQTLADLPAASPAPARTAELPRFGEFLVGQGYINGAQLRAGLARQREAAALGVHKTIGQTLLAMGILTREQLELASIQQVKQLQTALEAANRQLEQRVAERTQALEAALRRLTELDELKANFIANISHELRTPLVPLKGFADLLLHGSLGALTESQHEAIETIGRSAERLEALINSLIQFASSVKGKLVINATPVHLPALAGPLWDYFEPRASDRMVRLRRSLPADLPAVQADGEKIYWVLYQLVDNAVKFTPPGGEVVLAAERRPASLRVAVRDTGVGIAPERLGLIFEAFTQAVDRPETYDGTGLGLALVKRIVEAHDSRVEVDSQPNQGSTFAFELPLAASPAAP